MNIFAEPDVPHITVDELKKALDTNEECLLLDVRTADEYTRGHIPKSIHLPIDQFPTLIAKTAPNKSTKIYVYCLSGSRSSVAVDWMIQQGYTNTFDVNHGLLAWRAQYYPIST